MLVQITQCWCSRSPENFWHNTQNNSKANLLRVSISQTVQMHIFRNLLKFTIGNVGMLKYLGKQMNYVMAESNPVVTNMRSWTHLRTQQFQKQYTNLLFHSRKKTLWDGTTLHNQLLAAYRALDYRVARLLHNTAMLLNKRARNTDMFTAWNQTCNYMKTHTFLYFTIFVLLPHKTYNSGFFLINLQCQSFCM